MIKKQGSEPRYEAAQELSGLDVTESVQRAFSATRRNLWLAIICALLFAALGMVYASTREAYYQARASIIIDPRVAESIDPDRLTSIYLDDALVVDSQVEILSSERLLLAVIERLGLTTREAERLVTDGKPVPDDEDLRRRLVRDLRDDLTVERGPRTFVIHITARSEDPLLAAEIANALAETYFAAQMETHLSQANNVSDWLGRELAGLRTELHDAELRMERYLLENSIPGEDALNAVEEELAALERAMVAARGRVREAEAEISIIDRTVSPPVGEVNAVAAATLIEALGGNESVRTDQILLEVARLREVRQARREIAQTEMVALASQAAELRVELARIGEFHVGYRQLRREAEALNSNFETLLARFEQSQRDDRYYRSNARIIQSATVPSSPANRRRSTVVAAFGIGGLIIGLGLIFLREQIDDSLRRSDDVMTRLCMPYLGPVPLLARRDVSRLTPDLERRTAGMSRRARREIGRLAYAAQAPFSMLAETLRRTSLSLRARHGDNRRIVVASTSVTSGEGKSFFAANLAFFLASQGNRVLLVDGDTRNSFLSRTLVPLLKDHERSDLCDGTITLGTLSDNLKLMFVRDYNTMHSAEQHLKAMLALLQRPETDVDFVVVDTAPLAFVSDSLLLASMLDSAILMAAWGRTTVGTVRRVLAMNGAIADKMLGASISRVKIARMKQYEMLPFSDAYYHEGPFQPVTRPRATQ